MNYQQARAAGLQTFEGKPCKRGHGTIRRVHNRECVECRRLVNIRDAAKISARASRWAKANRERHNKKTQQWAARNKDLRAANSMRRAAAKLQRFPKWARTPEERSAMAGIYREAQRVTAATGVLHVVDHFYPLRGETVSGLHVASNLRVIPATENLRKGNFNLEDMWT